MTEDRKKATVDRLAKAWAKVAEGDKTLWRHPIAEVVVALLKENKPLTAETIIARLREEIDETDPTVRRLSREQAIEKLSAFR